jgi:hypothetical protein
MEFTETNNNETELTATRLADAPSEQVVDSNSIRGMRVKSNVKAGIVPDAPDRK